MKISVKLFIPLKNSPQAHGVYEAHMPSRNCQLINITKVQVRHILLFHLRTSDGSRLL